MRDESGRHDIFTYTLSNLVEGGAAGRPILSCAYKKTRPAHAAHLEDQQAHVSTDQRTDLQTVPPIDGEKTPGHSVIGIWRSGETNSAMVHVTAPVTMLLAMVLATAPTVVVPIVLRHHSLLRSLRTDLRLRPRRQQRL